MPIVKLGHDLVGAMVPDIMHEFELGEWKKLLTHLIRMLWSMPGGALVIAEFNER